MIIILSITFVCLQLQYILRECWHVIAKDGTVLKDQREHVKRYEKRLEGLEMRKGSNILDHIRFPLFFLTASNTNSKFLFSPSTMSLLFFTSFCLFE